MSKHLPKVGDYIELEEDMGNVSNSPWTSKVTEITDKGYLVEYNDGEKPYEIPEEAFYDSKTVDGSRFCYAKNPNISNEEIPVTTVPIQTYNEGSINAYKYGVIYPDNWDILVEEDVNPLRDISLEDSGSVIYFMDIANRSYEHATNLLETSMKDGAIESESLESYKDIQDAISKLGDKFRHLVSSRMDICYENLKKLKEVENMLKDYTPGKESYKTKYAVDIRANNSLSINEILAAGKRQVGLAKFIANRYKETLRNNIITVITEINRQSKRNYLDTKLNAVNLNKVIKDVSTEIKETLSVNLIDLIIGVSDKRELIGGYTLERVADWKSNLVSITSLLRLKPAYSVNVSRLIKLSRKPYKGDNIVKPFTKQEAKALLDLAKELLVLSKVKEDEITFDVREFSNIIDTIYVDNTVEKTVTALRTNREDAIQKQIAGISIFPMRVIYRNINAASALIKFVEEGIKRGQ